MRHDTAAFIFKIFKAGSRLLENKFKLHGVTPQSIVYIVEMVMDHVSDVVYLRAYFTVSLQQWYIKLSPVVTNHKCNNTKRVVRIT
jgi:hypothetical protein